MPDQNLRRQYGIPGDDYLADARLLSRLDHEVKIHLLRLRIRLPMRFDAGLEITLLFHAGP